MAYNILAETDKQINWTELYKDVYNPELLIEFIPIPKNNSTNQEALGIAIPSKNCCKEAWNQLKTLIDILQNKYNFKLYDMYYGAKIDEKLLESIKKNIV